MVYRMINQTSHEPFIAEEDIEAGAQFALHFEVSIFPFELNHRNDFFHLLRTSFFHLNQAKWLRVQQPGLPLRYIQPMKTDQSENKAGYTAQDAPSMRTFHLRK